MTGTRTVHLILGMSLVCHKLCLGLPYVVRQRNPVGNLDVGLIWGYKSLLTAWAQVSSTHLEHETRKEQRQGRITGPAEEKAAEETGKVMRVGKKSESC